MTYRALAVDYDGTLAHEGRVDALTLAALERARAEQLRLIMVTGRELPDLFDTFPSVRVFDRVVAENGAVLFDPASARLAIMAPAPPTSFVDRLVREGVPLSVGHSVVATVEPHQHAVLAAIRDLHLDWHVIFNKGAVMALPSDVTKVSGLMSALEALAVTAAETIAVGDGENDVVFLRACGLAVAVQNALPEVKRTANLVMPGARGRGVVELIELWLDGRLDDGF